jgi:glycerol-1-phosphate dehydrogenase [NAD(P)+]
VEDDVAGALNGLGSYALATQAEVWGPIGPCVLNRPVHHVPVLDMELSALESAAAGCPPVDVVVGLGGGSCLDTAKFVAWKRGLPLVLMPTIVSVDAAYTDSVGARVEGRVRYVGEVLADRVVLDLGFIASAPPEMNRAGIGDLLSCRTALHDWRLAAAAGQGVPWDESRAELARSLLLRLEEALPEIRSVTPTGLRFLAEAQRDMGIACHQAGHSRFEEGSEHFLAYCYESRTRRRHLHGELVCLCTALTSWLQGNDPARVVSVIEGAGARAHPADVRVTPDDMLQAVLALPTYARDERLDFCFVDVDPPSRARARECLDWAMACLPRVGV